MPTSEALVLRQPDITPALAAKRALAPDIARLAGMLAVITLHVSGPMAASRGSLPTHVWVTGVMAQALCGFAVPLFVMISGALLLRPTGESPRVFLARRLGRIAIPLVFWTALYILFSIFVRGNTPADFNVIVKQIGVGRGYTHLYFLWLMLGLYVITPFLRTLVSALDRTRLVQLTAVALAGPILDTFLRAWLSLAYVETLVSWFVPFVGYFLLGHVLYSMRLTRKHFLIAGGAYLGAAAIISLWWALLQKVTGQALALWPSGRLSPLVLVTAASVFVLARHLAEKWKPLSSSMREWIARLSELSFGVYLIHPLLVFAFYEVLPLEQGTILPIVGLIGPVLAIALISLAIVAMLASIPVLCRLVGFASGLQPSSARIRG